MDEAMNTPTNPFDVEGVRALVQLMKECDVSEVDLQDGNRRVRLRRGSRVISAPWPQSSPLYLPPL